MIVQNTDSFLVYQEQTGKAIRKCLGNLSLIEADNLRSGVGNNEVQMAFIRMQQEVPILKINAQFQADDLGLGASMNMKKQLGEIF